jgi:hypothetical protein
VTWIAAAVFQPAEANPFFFSTGDSDGKLGSASRPASTGKLEIESADDFVLSSATTLTAATFTGLLPVGATRKYRGQRHQSVPEPNDGRRGPCDGTRGRLFGDALDIP